MQCPRSHLQLLLGSGIQGLETIRTSSCSTVSPPVIAEGAVAERVSARTPELWMYSCATKPHGAQQ